MPAQERTAPRELEKDLLVWSAPARPFKRRSRDFYITVIAMAAIVGLVLFFVDGFLPVILIVSLIFLFYVLSTVPPENIDYKITNRGIKIAGKRTDWQNMNRFWTTRRFDTELLVVETFSLPGRLEIVISPELKGEIEKTLTKYLVHEEIPASVLDRSANWIARRLPS